MSRTRKSLSVFLWFVLIIFPMFAGAAAAIPSVSPNCKDIIDNPLFQYKNLLNEKVCAAYQNLRTTFDQIPAGPEKATGITMLHPAFAVNLNNMLVEARKLFPGIGIQSGFRTKNQEDAIRNSPGGFPARLQAPGLYSLHAEGLAADLVYPEAVGRGRDVCQMSGSRTGKPLEANHGPKSYQWVAGNAHTYNILLYNQRYEKEGFAPGECNHVEAVNVSSKPPSPAAPGVSGARTPPAAGLDARPDPTTKQPGPELSKTDPYKNPSLCNTNPYTPACAQLMSDYQHNNRPNISNSGSGGGGSDSSSMMTMMMGMMMIQSMSSAISNSRSNTNYAPAPAYQPTYAPLPPLPATVQTPVQTTPAPSSVDTLVAGLNATSTASFPTSSEPPVSATTSASTSTDTFDDLPVTVGQPTVRPAAISALNRAADSIQVLIDRMARLLGVRTR